MFIVWTSDHGDMQGDHYLWRKGFPAESSARVPLVVRWPKSAREMSGAGFVRRGFVSDALVEMRDLAPTFYDIAGVLADVRARDPMMDGTSLLPLLTNETTTPASARAFLDLEHNDVFAPRIHWNAFVSADGWKYVYNAHDGTEQLFDLSADPHELNDLGMAADGDERVKQKIEMWRGKLIAKFQEEGRGSLFLDGGELVVPRLPLLFGPNYPCYDGYVPFYIPH